MSTIKHTIFTPVYNRKEGIIFLYEKIKLINYPNDKFEWIIIDDGSTDNLKETVDEIINKSKINVQYFYKPNEGIHTAQNFAIKVAKGEYITRIDSDDFLLPDSLMEKDRFLEKIPNQLKDKVAGVVGLCINLSDGTIRGSKFPKDEEITTGYKLIKKGVKGDRNFCIKTDIMKQFLIPEYHDTKWVAEGSALWLKLDRHYLTYFVNTPFSVCAEPNLNSVSGQMKEKTIQNIMSKYYDCIESLNYSKDLIGIKKVLFNYIRISYYSILSNNINKGFFKRVLIDLIHPIDKIMTIFLFPLGGLVYIKKK